MGQAWPLGQYAPAPEGKVNCRLEPFEELKLPANCKLLEITVLPVGVKPLPVMVTRVPIGPDDGERVEINRIDAGVVELGLG